MALVAILATQDYDTEITMIYKTETYIGYVVTNPINFSSITSDITDYARDGARFNFNIEFIGVLQ